MKKILLLLFIIINTTGFSQKIYFPPVLGDAWETTDPNSLGWCQDKIDSLNKFLENNNSKAFILLKDGKIVVEKYFGNFTKDSAWYWASAGKSLTAFLVGLAQEDKYFSINEPSSKYLGKGWTNATEDQESKITIRHQLTMTTGLDDGVANNHCTEKTCLNYLAEPGSRWAYHNGPYTRLDSIIEVATNMKLNNYLQLKLRATTGITGGYFKVKDDNVFFSKARSMARFGLLMLNKGNWNGQQIMNDSIFFNEMIHTSQILNPSYGFLWWLNGKSTYKLPGIKTNLQGPLLPDAPDDVIAAIGKNGQLINISPKSNLVFIRIGESTEKAEVSTNFNNEIWKKLNTVICSVTNTTNTSFQNCKIDFDPAYRNIKVNFLSKIFDVSLYDSKGQIISESKNNLDATIVHINEEENGIFFVKVITNSNDVVVKKIGIVN